MVGNRVCRATRFHQSIEGGRNPHLLLHRGQVDLEVFKVRAGNRPLAEHSTTKFTRVGIIVKALEIGLEVGRIKTISPGANEENVVCAEQGLGGRNAHQTGFTTAASRRRDYVPSHHFDIAQFLPPHIRLRRPHKIEALEVDVAIGGYRA